MQFHGLLQRMPDGLRCDHAPDLYRSSVAAVRRAASKELKRYGSEIRKCPANRKQRGPEMLIRQEEIIPQFRFEEPSQPDPGQSGPGRRRKRPSAIRSLVGISRTPRALTIHKNSRARSLGTS